MCVQIKLGGIDSFGIVTVHWESSDGGTIILLENHVAQSIRGICCSMLEGFLNDIHHRETVRYCTSSLYKCTDVLLILNSEVEFKL